MSSSTIPIVVGLRPNPSDLSCTASRHLAERLNLPLAEGDWTTQAPLALMLDESTNRLAIVDREHPTGPGISVETKRIPIKHGRVQIDRKQPLCKAFGPKVASIVDATAGLGQDAIMLACMGFEVLAIEREPVLAALLENGVERAMNDGRLRAALEGHLTVLWTDSIEYLGCLGTDSEGDGSGGGQGRGGQPDAVYLDPMFPAKRKTSALSKKPIRVVRALAGDDPDVDELFEGAMSAARHRVVVKRADDAAPLAPGPVASFTGNLVRYDVYSPGAGGRRRLKVG